jgi:hypothetical protein
MASIRVHSLEVPSPHEPQAGGRDGFHAVQPGCQQVMPCLDPVLRSYGASARQAVERVPTFLHWFTVPTRAHFRMAFLSSLPESV